MTEVLYNPKIKPEHLARKAIVYLRQSSEKQVRQNKESQLLQYAVAERVRALGHSAAGNGSKVSSTWVPRLPDIYRRRSGQTASTSEYWVRCGRSCPSA